MTGRNIWQIALVVSGIVYLLEVLSADYQSPLFAVLFVIVATSELIATHRQRR